MLHFLLFDAGKAFQNSMIKFKIKIPLPLIFSILSLFLVIVYLCENILNFYKGNGAWLLGISMFLNVFSYRYNLKVSRSSLIYYIPLWIFFIYFSSSQFFDYLRYINNDEGLSYIKYVTFGTADGVFFSSFIGFLCASNLVKINYFFSSYKIKTNVLMILAIILYVIIYLYYIFK